MKTLTYIEGGFFVEKFDKANVDCFFTIVVFPALSSPRISILISLSFSLTYR